MKNIIYEATVCQKKIQHSSTVKSRLNPLSSGLKEVVHPGIPLSHCWVVICAVLIRDVEHKNTYTSRKCHLSLKFFLSDC